MPYETHFVDGGKGVLKLGHGLVTSADLLASSLQRSLDVERNRQRLIKYGLVDLSKTTELQVSIDTVHKLVEIDRKIAEYSPGCFVAVVAPDCLAFGMSRLWASFTKEIGWNAHVFRDRESALEWLRTMLGNGNPENCPYDDFPFLRPGPEKP